MSDRPRVHWASEPPESSGIGNSAGYAGANRALMAEARAAGLDLVGPEDEADIDVHLTPLQAFRPREGRKTLWWTMVENDDPAEVAERASAFEGATAIATPSEWCRRILAPHTDRRISIVPLGFDPKLFQPKKRTWRPGGKDGPFRLLYVGAPNQRKYTCLPQFWKLVMQCAGRLQFYIKTTGASMSADHFKSEKGVDFSIQKTPFGQIVSGRLGRRELLTIDNRRLPMDRIPDLYHDAHALWLVSAGEGWGMTAVEGMATGLPVIVTDHSGTTEYATKKNAYLVPARKQPLKPRDGGEPVEMYWPDADVAMQHIGRIWDNYGRAAMTGLRAARDVSGLTWANSARALAKLVRTMV